jgi:hypothetical protein
VSVRLRLRAMRRVFGVDREEVKGKIRKLYNEVLFICTFYHILLEL